MTKYRKKPVVVEAFQWTADRNQTEDPEWIIKAIDAGEVFFINQGTPDICMVIKTLEGNHLARRGWWIVKGIKGEIYPVEDDIFEQTYEHIEEADNGKG